MPFWLATITNKEISQIRKEARQQKQGEEIWFGSIYLQEKLCNLKLSMKPPKKFDVYKFMQIKSCVTSFKWHVHQNTVNEITLKLN